MLTHIKSNDNHWTVVINGQPHQFDHTHHNYAALVECVHSGDADEFVAMLNAGDEIEDWSDGDFQFKDGFLYFEDEQIASDPTNRIIQCIKQGFPHKPILNYLTNLYDNVSERAVQESYTWSSHKGLPITDDGMMVGYKGVRTYDAETSVQGKNGEIQDGDLVDIYTGNSFRNNPGDKCSMKRRQVCDDHTQGCSSGLHVGTYDYACDWAGPHGTVVLVKFNPKDIVSVPSDCNCQKMRVSEYEVISVAREQLEEAVYDHDDYNDIDYHIDDYNGWSQDYF
jgi:hypothetical protein|tara:strand:- start:646 stop:1488 length:843 start_codon:yes stop_codon:yes gene_type:complete